MNVQLFTRSYKPLFLSNLYIWKNRINASEAVMTFQLTESKYFISPSNGSRSVNINKDINVFLHNCVDPIFFSHRERDGEGQRAPPHKLRGLGSAVNSHSRPGKFEIWCNLRPQNSPQKCLITCKLPQKG